MKRTIPERQYYPYLPVAMRRLVHAGAKMSDRRVKAAKSELMSKPLDYVIIRLEEQLRAVKHAVYIQKQPTVAKNMQKFGFTGFVYEHVDPANVEDAERVNVLQREQDAVRNFQDRYLTAHDQQGQDSRSAHLMNRSNKQRLKHPERTKMPASITGPPKIPPRPALHLQHNRHPLCGKEIQTPSCRGTQTANGDASAQTTEGKLVCVDRRRAGKVIDASTGKRSYAIKMTDKFRDARRFRQERERLMQQRLAWRPLKSKKKRDRPFWMENPKSRGGKVSSNKKEAPDAPILLTLSGNVILDDRSLTPSSRGDLTPSPGGRSGGTTPGGEDCLKKHRKKRKHKPKIVTPPPIAPPTTAELLAAAADASTWGSEKDHDYHDERLSTFERDPYTAGPDGARPGSRLIPKDQMVSDINDIKEQLKLELKGQAEKPVTSSGIDLGPQFVEDESMFREPPKPVSSSFSMTLVKEHVGLTYDLQLMKQGIQPDVIGRGAAPADKAPPVENDPLPRSPSGTWHWRELQQELEEQRAAQLRGSIKHMEPPNNLLQQHDDGLYRLDTESSHVDINVPADHGHHDKVAVPVMTFITEPFADADADYLASDLYSFGKNHPPDSISQEAINDHGVIPIHDDHHNPRDASDEVRNEQASFKYDSTHVEDEGKAPKGPPGSSGPTGPLVDPHPLQPAPSGTWPWKDLQAEKEAEAKNTTIHVGSEKDDHIQLQEDGTPHFNTDSSYVDLTAHPEIHEDWPKNLKKAPGPSGSKVNAPGEPLPDAYTEQLASDLRAFGEDHSPRPVSPGTQTDHGVIPIHDTHHQPAEASDEVKQERDSFKYDSTHVHDEGNPKEQKDAAPDAGTVTNGKSEVAETV
ncbi:hypothetical protein BV898_14080 [Hypsibius exemplaris]|uniref:Uncharacterized protein n=1 Tax=Hypsibius exemplaris TaxID=2072580 RepID=A0A1W0W917_HYPEX|nr:hypothetical protein BV898_14080 [Hypsibius exemplaris]